MGGGGGGGGVTTREIENQKWNIHKLTLMYSIIWVSLFFWYYLLSSIDQVLLLAAIFKPILSTSQEISITKLFAKLEPLARE